MKSSLLAIATICSLFLTSCASKFTAAQKEQLSTVAISPVSVADKAYKEPDGGDRAAANAAGMSGATAGAGALGGLVGSLVGESIAATQNSVFKGKSKQYFEAVKSNTPEPAQYVQTELKKSMKSDAFFGTRLRNSSPNTFTSKVISYGLVRAGKGQDGNLMLTAQVTLDIRLKDSAGKNLAGGLYTGTGHNHPIETYASNRAETRKSFELAIEKAVSSFNQALDLKTAD